MSSFQTYHNYFLAILGLFVQNQPIAPRQKALKAVHWKWRPQHPADVADPGIYLIQQKWASKNFEGGSASLGNAGTKVTYMMHHFDYERRERDPKNSLEFDSEGSKQVIKQFLSMPNLKDWAIRSRLA